MGDTEDACKLGRIGESKHVESALSVKLLALDCVYMGEDQVDSFLRKLIKGRSPRDSSSIIENLILP